jgi:hypothetical protein
MTKSADPKIAGLENAARRAGELLSGSKLQRLRRDAVTVGANAAEIAKEKAEVGAARLGVSGAALGGAYLAKKKKDEKTAGLTAQGVNRVGKALYGTPVRAGVTGTVMASPILVGEVRKAKAQQAEKAEKTAGVGSALRRANELIGGSKLQGLRRDVVLAHGKGGDALVNAARAAADEKAKVDATRLGAAAAGGLAVGAAAGRASKGTEKKASWKNLFKDPATAVPLIGMLAAPLVGAGINAAAGAKQRRDSAKEKTVAFRSMLDLHPHLKTRDSGEVSRIYNSLHNANPLLARDPMVAGAWVDNIIESKGPGQETHQQLLNAVKDLAGIRSNMATALRNESGRAGPGARFEKAIGELSGGIGKAYAGGNGHAEAKKLIDKDIAYTKELRQGLEHRSKELQQKEHALHDLAHRIGVDTEYGEPKQASALDLDRLFAEIGI